MGELKPWRPKHWDRVTEAEIDRLGILQQPRVYLEAGADALLEAFSNESFKKEMEEFWEKSRKRFEKLDKELAKKLNE